MSEITVTIDDGRVSVEGTADAPRRAATAALVAYRGVKEHGETHDHDCRYPGDLLVHPRSVIQWDDARLSRTILRPTYTTASQSIGSMGLKRSGPMWMWSERLKSSCETSDMD